MWFKNLKIYSFSKPFSINPETLDAQLAEKTFQPCGSLQPSSYGWVSPLGNEGQQLHHSIGKTTMICARHEEKILPANVVNELLDEKLDIIQADSGRRPVGKHKQSIKDELIHELLPRAFSKSRKTCAYMDLTHQFLVVDAASNNKAEELLQLLRQCLGSLPVIPLKTKMPPATLMTQWLKGESQTEDFLIKDECELREADDEGAIIRCRRQDLNSNEIQSHLDAGKTVSKLAINWDDRLDCILQDDLAIKRLKFADEILEQAADDGAEDAASRFDADFNLMSGELGRFISRLITILGAEQYSV